MRPTAAHDKKCQGSTPYSGSSFTCAGDNGQPSDAVHTWEGRHYCAFHSPFDVVEGEAPPKLHQGMAVSVQFWGRDVDCILSELDDFSGEWWISLPNTSGSFTRVPTYRITSRKA